MPDWTVWFIVAVFGAVLAYHFAHRRRVDREWMDADIQQIRGRCDVATGPDGTEYAVLKSEYRPTAAEDARNG